MLITFWNTAHAALIALLTIWLLMELTNPNHIRGNR